MTSQVLVSIIIVNFNTRNFTAECIESVYKYTADISFEIILVDNASTDDTVAYIRKVFPNVRIIQNEENLGFGAANNRALEIAVGKYIFYLNSDTLLLNNAVKAFYNYWESSNERDCIGALGCVLQDTTGKKIHSGGELPDYNSIIKQSCKVLISHIKWTVCKFLHIQDFVLKIWNKIHFYPEVKTECGEIGYITGADLFLKNNDLAKYDENYFLYYEESDLQCRLAGRGLKRLIIDSPKIIHREKIRKTGFEISSYSVVQSQRSSLYYAQKNCRKKARLLKCLIKLDWMNPYVRKFCKNVSLPPPTYVE